MSDAIRIAFSTYSRIPVGRSDWSERGMTYSLCFFPLIGAVIGAAEYLLAFLLFRAHAGALLRGCLLAVVPILITGGIHMDGFMDTCDALQSMKSREEKLAIMKDPHVGGFAVIGLAVYLVLSVGAWSGISLSSMPLVFFIFLLSRALSAMAASSFPKAKKNGMLVSMTEPMTMRALGITGVEVMALMAVILLIGLVNGCLLPAFFILLLFAAVYVIYFYVMLFQFGGTTGDLAGWFLQLAELVCLLAAALIL